MKQAKKIDCALSLNQTRTTSLPTPRSGQVKKRVTNPFLQQFQNKQQIMKTNHNSTRKNAHLKTQPVKPAAFTNNSKFIKPLLLNQLSIISKTQTIRKSVDHRKKIKSIVSSPQNKILSPHKNSIRVRVKTLRRKQRDEKETSIKLTDFQQKETQIYQLLYIGPRRITEQSSFTTKEGNPIIQIGDSIMYRYEILDQLGSGAFGFVFKAYDHKKNEVVALKIIKNSPKYQKQAKVQVRMLEQAAKNDINENGSIIELKHAFLFRGHPCLTFQLLYKNLYQFARQMRPIGMPIQLIRRISIQVLHGLNLLAKHKMIHCDIKPQNIMLRKQHKTGVKIIDLGSGCFEKKQIYNYIQSRFYRAPQIVLGIPYTNAIDMWSFGCVVIQMFTGFPIFASENEMDQIILLIETLNVPPVQFINRGVRSYKYFANGQFKVKNPIVKGKLRIPGMRSLQKIMQKCEDPFLIDFVSKIMKWVPQQRMKACQALVHPWILAGIPQDLIQEHKRNIKL